MRASLPGLALLLGLAIAPMALSAQENGRITGRVSDATTGAPMSQVQVFLEGTGLGTLTRQDGRYLLLNVPAGTYTIRAERIGQAAASQEVRVPAGGAVEVDLTMTTQALGLDEIVVTGTAGASRRREIGNTVSQITVADLPNKPVVVTDMLQSAAPGIEVTSVGGEMGQGKAIRLRGAGSVSMTSHPIIYIDGVRMMSEAFPDKNPPDRRTGRSANVSASPLDAINPNDIERIEVIKGAAATTLYGTEASGGVIQVFTKRGSQGAPVWTVETQQGTAWSRKFGGADGPAAYGFMQPFLRQGWFGLGNGDWGTVHNQQYFGSVRGGGQNLQYFLSGQFNDEVGVLPNDALNKYVVRGNFTFTPVEDLQVQFNSTYSNTMLENTPSANNAQGLTLNAFRQERNYFGSGEPDSLVKVLEQQLDQQVERFTTGGTVTYSPLTNLTNRLTIGYDYSQQESRNVRPFGFVFMPDGTVLNNNWQKRILTFDYVGTYSADLTDALRTNFSWGGQAVGDDQREVEAYGETFPGAADPTVNSAATSLGFEERQKIWNAGFFLQNVFDVSNKYFLTLGGRVDGNSAFGSDFGLQFYPKASLAWVLSDEDFWSPGLGEIKLRAAYGQSGRAPGAFDAVRTWNPVGWGGIPAFVPRNVGNADLGPEVTKEIEAGFDAAWFENRLSSSFTYYRQTTDDALMEVAQIPSEGFGGSQLENVGKIRNSGLELALNAALVQTADWGLDMGLNVATNNSKVLSLGGNAPFNSNGGWIEEGYPIFVMRADQVLNPDESTTASSQVDIELDHLWGPRLPTRIISGFSQVRLPWNGISLSARGEYQGGHYIENSMYSVDRSVRSPICYPYYTNPETSTALKDEMPAIWRARCTSSINRGYVWKADFFKLRSVTATIPMDFAFPETINNSVLTLSLDNSYLWMKEMPFMDPEMLGQRGARELSTGFTERIPTPIMLRASLRLTF